MSGDLISRAELLWDLEILEGRLRMAGECGGCEAELLQAVVKLVDAQKAVDAAIARHGSKMDGGENA